MNWISAKQASEKYGISHNTLIHAMWRKAFPSRLVGGKVRMFDETTLEFQKWLERWQKRLDSIQAPKEATIKKQPYSRQYYQERVKPNRAKMREARHTT